MKSRPELKTWVPWQEVAKTPRTSIEELQEILRRYKRSSILLGCARLSVVFNFGPEATTATNKDLALRWIPVLFPPSLVNRVSLLAKADRIIFFQGQLRFLASEAIRIEVRDESSLPVIPNEQLGELLLRTAELLYHPHPSPSDPLDRIANAVARFLPIYEIDSPTDAIIPLLRFSIFLRVIIPRLPEKLKTFDVEKFFEDKVGFPLKLYTEFIFAFAVHAVSERHERQVGQVIDAGIRVSWFKHMNLRSEAVEAMFKEVSFSLDDELNDIDHHGYADFDFLRDHPYLSFEEALYCLDYEFSFGKLESGVIWRMLRHVPNGGDYLTFWGSVFEHYVAWLFETYASARMHKVYVSPAYEDNPSRQICDVIVICDGTAVLVEAKLATCRSDIRYSGDYQKMRAFLERRLVSGDDGAVGVGQLLNAIRNLATGARSAVPDWVANIRKFIPLIVTKDDIGSAWEVNEYLNTRFEDQFNRKEFKGYTVTPLVSMGIATLEQGIGWLEKMPFSKILEERIKADRQLRMPFEAASRYIGRGKAVRLKAHIDILHEVMAEVAADFDLKEDDAMKAAEPNPPA